MTSGRGNLPADEPPAVVASAGEPPAGEAAVAERADGVLPPAGEPVDRTLPPDPAAYDSDRAVLARARGLSAPYIAGGRDPEPDAGRREERFYGRLLLAMVVIVVLAGFVLGILGNVITALRGG
jgi:hypothetical protein